MINQFTKVLSLAGLMLAAQVYFSPASLAQETATIDVAEFHRILQSINEANIPDNVKEQLFSDMKASMIENVRLSRIPDEVKRVLIRDLESTTRQ